MRARHAVLPVALVVAAVGSPGPGLAEPRFPAGTVELNLTGGYSRSFNVDSESGVNGFHLIPHIGVFLTDEGPGWAPGWLRGNLQLIAEPTFIHLDTPEPDNHGGVSALARWVFAGGGVVRPYVEAGGGILVGESGIPQTDCEVLFTVHAGVGLLVFVSERNAVAVGTRFHHVSNGSLCAGNFSLNSGLFTLGLSAFFP